MIAFRVCILFLVRVVIALDTFHQIGLKEECFDSMNSLIRQRWGSLALPNVSSLKEAAIVCLDWCKEQNLCRATVTFSYKNYPACFLSLERFLGFDQDIVRVKLNTGKEPQTKPRHALPHDLRFGFPNDEIKGFIATGIREENYYAFNMVLPSFPQIHSLTSLSRILPENLNLISDVNEFPSLKHWEEKLPDIFSDHSHRQYLVFQFQVAIEESFFKPKRNLPQTLLVNNTEWKKHDIILMVRRILNKVPLDPSMVYAYAEATFPYSKFQSATPEALKASDLQNIDHSSIISQAFQLSNGHWIILKWKPFQQDTVTIVSTRPTKGPLLSVPSIKKYVEQASCMLGVRVPKQENTLIYTKCREKDEAFCAIFINAYRSVDLSASFDTEIPDDIRLWMAYDLMRRFSLTANEVDKTGVRRNREGDLDFHFTK